MTRVATARARADIDPRIGLRLRAARQRAGLTQKQLAGDRYTGAYVSALENGLIRASLRALGYLAGRLELPIDHFLHDPEPGWTRAEADALVAAGEWQAAADAYTGLLDAHPPETDRPALLLGRAEAYAGMGRAREALVDAADAHERFGRGGEQADAARAACLLAWAHHQLDNLDEARSLLEQVLGQVRDRLGADGDFRIRVLTMLAGVESSAGRHRDALALLEEARDVGRSTDDRSRAGHHLAEAQAAARSGHHDRAIAGATRAAALFEAAESERALVAIEHRLALEQLALGNLRRARQAAREGRRLAGRLGERRLLVGVMESEAQIELAAGEPAVALERSGGTLELAREVGDPTAEAAALLTQARARRALGEPAGAEASYGEAASVLRRSGPRPRLHRLLREWAELLVEQRRHEEAVALLQEAAGQTA